LREHKGAARATFRFRDIAGLGVSATFTIRRGAWIRSNSPLSRGKVTSRVGALYPNGLRGRKTPLTRLACTQENRT
jgi:hypothetical protein